MTMLNQKIKNEPLDEIDIKNEFKFVCEKLDISEYLENLMRKQIFKDYNQL